MGTTVTDKKGLLRINDQLCFALYSASRAITKQYAILLDNLGVTYPQYLALLVLWEADGLSIQTIATSLELDGATTTPLIQRLEKLGLVSRQRSTEDERKVQVFLTPKGRNLYKKAVAIPHDLGCAIGVDQKTATRLIKETSRIKDYITSKSKS